MLTTLLLLLTRTIPLPLPLDRIYAETAVVVVVVAVENGGIGWNDAFTVVNTADGRNTAHQTIDIVIIIRQIYKKAMDEYYFFG